MNQKTDGFTPMQQLFVGYGQNWCSNERPEYLTLSARVDEHAPDKARANGVVRNMPEFAGTFGCKKGSPMVAAKQCRVW